MGSGLLQEQTVLGIRVPVVEQVTVVLLHVCKPWMPETARAGEEARDKAGG